jgi:nucleoside phosphorylase
MKILIMSALKSEISAFFKTYHPETIYQTRNQGLARLDIQGNTYYFGTSGVGWRNTRRFLADFLEREKCIDLIVSTGYAGAVSLTLKAGDIVLPDVIVELETGQKHNVPAKIQISGRFSKNQLTGYSVNKIFDRTDKEILRKDFPDAGFIDMESGALAGFLEQQGIPYLIIRGISDSAGSRLPRLEFIRDSWKGIDLIKLLGSPADLFRIIKLLFNIKKAKKNIFRIIKSCFISKSNNPKILTL